MGDLTTIPITQFLQALYKNKRCVDIINNGNTERMKMLKVEACMIDAKFFDYRKKLPRLIS